MRSFRNTMLTDPRWRNTFALKRPTPGTECAKSTSPSSSKRDCRLEGMMTLARRSASYELNGGWSSLRTRPPSRMAGGEFDLMWRSDASLVASSRRQSTSSTNVPLDELVEVGDPGESGVLDEPGRWGASVIRPHPPRPRHRRRLPDPPYSTRSQPFAEPRPDGPGASAAVRKSAAGFPGSAPTRSFAPEPSPPATRSET